MAARRVVLRAMCGVVVDLPLCRETQYGVFSTAQAGAVGLDRSRLHRMVRAGQLVSLRRGVYQERWRVECSSAEDRGRARAVAAALACSGATLSHDSAALIHGLPGFGSVAARPTLTRATALADRGQRTSLQKILVAALPVSHVVNRGDWAVTTVERTICDLGRSQPIEQAIAVADAAMNRGFTSKAALARVAACCDGWPGARSLRQVMELADAGSESPYESLARIRLVQAGMITQAQVWAFDSAGPIGCGDLWLPYLWTFLEVDGDVKYAGAATTLLEEKRRQERLEDAGFGVARASPAQIMRGDDVVQRVLRAAHRGRLARSALRYSGYVGPPPAWARRGSSIRYAYASQAD